MPRKSKKRKPRQPPRTESRQEFLEEERRLAHLMDEKPIKLEHPKVLKELTVGCTVRIIRESVYGTFGLVGVFKGHHENGYVVKLPGTVRDQFGNAVARDREVWAEDVEAAPGAEQPAFASEIPPKEAGAPSNERTRTYDTAT